MGWLTSKTFYLVTSAMIFAVVCILPETYNLPLIRLASGGLNVGETIFHETGHAIFGWLTGHVSIPSIFTFIRPQGSNLAGIALTFDRSLFLQLGALALLFYGSYRLHFALHRFEIPMHLLTITILLFTFTDYYTLLIDYGGHLTCMLLGSFFLYRGILSLDARSGFERWLNALFGWFLLLSNTFFSFRILTDPVFTESYKIGGIVATGNVIDNDYVKVSKLLGISLDAVSTLNLAMCAMLLIMSFILALRNYHPDIHPEVT